MLKKLSPITTYEKEYAKKPSKLWKFDFTLMISIITLEKTVSKLLFLLLYLFFKVFSTNNKLIKTEIINLLKSCFKKKKKKEK